MNIGTPSDAPRHAKGSARPLPRVSVIVPCRNERRHVDRLLDCLAAQLVPDGGFEVIVADGMSDDGTRERLQRRAAAWPRLRVIDNPAGIVSSALNRAIDAARGEIIVRMDAHTEYAADYLRECVRALDATGADNVGGPWRATGRTYAQRAIAIAFHSPFASGGAACHRIDYEGSVDTVYLGCWRKDTLVWLGGFDEGLIRNQDDDLNLRLTRRGGVVWQTPRVRSEYHPRSSLRVLFKQYAQYGYWKVRVIQKHRLPASPRHLIPGAFVASLTSLTALAPLRAECAWAAAALTAIYALANLAASVRVCAAPRRLRFLPVMPAVFAAYHIGYGYGFCRGVLDFLVLRRGGRSEFSVLTRNEDRPLVGQS